MDPQTTEDLNRAFEKLAQFKDDSAKKLHVPKPIVEYADKKTYVRNFRIICSKLNRDENDVSKFVEGELSAEGSVDGSGALKLGGRFNLAGVSKILKQYVENYMHCRECNGFCTDIIKENRIVFMKCKLCLSKKALSNA
jgi:translation initiation factor 2 subunit 2